MTTDPNQETTTVVLLEQQASAGPNQETVPAVVQGPKPASSLKETNARPSSIIQELQEQEDAL